MKTQTIEQWLKAGNVIKKAAPRKAKGYHKPTKFRANNHMGMKSETHKWWVDDEQKALLV